jgi:hypothetical protein
MKGIFFVVKNECRLNRGLYRHRSQQEIIWYRRISDALDDVS